MSNQFRCPTDTLVPDELIDRGRWQFGKAGMVRAQ